MSQKTIHRKSFKTYSGKEFNVTYFTFKGSRPGRTLTLIAGQHGMEHSGPNVLSLFADELEQRDFSGTVNICPCANPLALEIDYEIYPEKEDINKIDTYFYSRFRHDYCPWGLGRNDAQSLYNMNRLWGNKSAPGVAGEIVKWLWSKICSKADVIIDMHSLQSEKPLIYTTKKSLPISKVFGAEAIFLSEAAIDSYHSGNLLHFGSCRQKQFAFCVEFSIQHGIKDSEYNWGINGIFNVMKTLDMLHGEIKMEKDCWLLLPNITTLNSHEQGHIIFFKNLYDYVDKGQKLYEIRNIQTLDTVDEGFAPNDGILSYRTYAPVTNNEIPVCAVSQGRKIAQKGDILDNLKLYNDLFSP